MINDSLEIILVDSWGIEKHTKSFRLISEANCSREIAKGRSLCSQKDRKHVFATMFTSLQVSIV